MPSGAHQQRAVERRAAARENADDDEGLVGVLGEARPARVSGAADSRCAAVAEHDALADLIAVARSHLGADHHLEDVLGARRRLDEGRPAAKASARDSPWR